MRCEIVRQEKFEGFLAQLLIGVLFLRADAEAIRHCIEPGGLGRFVQLKKYDELYSYAWWSFTRCFGYVAVPFACWKLIFRKDSVLDMGLRFRGLLSHFVAEVGDATSGMSTFW